MKEQKVVKEETCLLDEKGKLKVVSGKETYFIILKSFHKTEIARDLEKEEKSEKKENTKDEDSYFYSDLEYVEEEGRSEKSKKENFKEKLIYKHQSLISVPPDRQELFEWLSERLKEEQILH